jgi:hypothetical protein
VGESKYFSVLVVDHDVVRLDVSMHDALAVAKVERLQQLKDVVSHVEVVELGVQAPKVGIVDVLEDQRRCFALCPPQGIRH